MMATYHRKFVKLVFCEYVRVFFCVCVSSVQFREIELSSHIDISSLFLLQDSSFSENLIFSDEPHGVF